MGGGGSRAVTFTRTSLEMRLTERGDCKTPKEMQSPLSHPQLQYFAISVTARYDSSPPRGASPTTTLLIKLSNLLEEFKWN